jgi:hypothetical protein
VDTGCHRRVELRGLAQHGQLCRLQSRARVDAQLVGQLLPGSPVDRQCTSLAARPVQGKHQLAGESFPQRFRGHERLQLGHQHLMAA